MTSVQSCRPAYGARPVERDKAKHRCKVPRVNVLRANRRPRAKVIYWPGFYQIGNRGRVMGTASKTSGEGRAGVRYF